MISRDELKSLIDRVPEDNLEAVRGMLDFNINPPRPHPEIEGMRQRTQQYRKLVEERFRQTQRPGTIGGFAGGGISGVREGVPFGRQSFSYWDDRALIEPTLQSFDGHDVEIMQRFSISPDSSKLVCMLELSSGGHTVQHSDEFPLLRSQKDA